VSAHSGQILAFWLLPAEPAQTHFQNVIRELAARFDAPVFKPHLTFYVTTPQNEDANDLLRRALAGAKPFRLLIESVRHSEAFTKSLFIQFTQDSALNELAMTFQAFSASHREYNVNPHLSLIYKTMLAETKASLAASIRFPFDEVLFDAAQGVVSPAPVISREHVEAWTAVASQRIAG